jgi:hypothetical protein
MKRFYRFLTTLTGPWSPLLVGRLVATPRVAMLPNPCLSTDVLHLHLRGLRSCLVQVQVQSSSRQVVLERQVTPLSNNHRLPMSLPRETPPGMYCCVATQAGCPPVQSWVALHA